jgi:hypothetical protein
MFTWYPDGWLSKFFDSPDHEITAPNETYIFNAPADSEYKNLKKSF